MTERVQSLVFDEVAELYAAVRPSYPPELIADLIGVARLGPAARVLELGAGPGNASVLFSGRGYELLCLEPGPSLAEVARRRLARDPNASVETTTFEAWAERPRRFDLVFAAQSIHWMDHAIAFPKAARVLKPGGVLALFANGTSHRASAAHDEIDAAYAAHKPGMSSTPWATYGTTFPRLYENEPAFEHVTSRSYVWQQRYPTARYLDLLRTYSDHRLLPPEQLDRLLGAVGAAIDRHGGELEIEYTTTLTYGRTRS